MLMHPRTQPLVCFPPEPVVYIPSSTDVFRNSPNPMEIGEMMSSDLPLALQVVC